MAKFPTLFLRYLYLVISISCRLVLNAATSSTTIDNQLARKINSRDDSSEYYVKRSALEMISRGEARRGNAKR
jgi:hypothetical protein